MDKCIAIPLENGVLCAHFGHCQKFAIVKVVNDAITEVREITPPDHVPGLYPRWVAQFGVTDVIAGGMGQQAIVLFNQQNINAYVGAPVKSPRELVGDFLANKLDLHANYCSHGGHHQHGGCRH
jgi:predicted Fe-Mo cluster-binding NifX family protein